MQAFFAWLLKVFLEFLYGKAKEEAKERIEIKEEGKKAEEAAVDAVSELQTPEGQSTPKPDEVPSVKKWTDYFKHRRNRKRL